MIHQDVKLDQVTFFIAAQFIIKRRIAARTALNASKSRK